MKKQYTLNKVLSILVILIAAINTTHAQLTPIWKYVNYFSPQFGGRHISFTIFSPDGSKLFIANTYEGAKIFDVKSGDLITTVPISHSDIVFSAAFSDDGNSIITGHNGSEYTHFRIFDTQTGKEKVSYEFKGNRDGYNIVHSVSLNEDASFAYVSLFGRLYKYSLASKTIAEISIKSGGHDKNFYLGNNLLLILKHLEPGVIYNTQYDKEVIVLSGTHTSVSEDRKWATSFDYRTGEMEIWDLTTFKSSLIQGVREFGSQAGISPINGKILNWKNDALNYFEIDGKSELSKKSSIPISQFSPSKDFQDDIPDKVYPAPVFSPDGSLFVVVAGDTAYMCRTSDLVSAVNESLNY